MKLEFVYQTFGELDYVEFKERLVNINSHLGELEERSVGVIRQMEDRKRWNLFNEGITRSKEMLGRDEPVCLCLADNTPSGGPHVVFGLIHPGYPLLVEIPQRPREQFATGLHVLDAFKLVIEGGVSTNELYNKIAFLPKANMHYQLNCLADIPEPIFLPLPEYLEQSNVIILEHVAPKNRVISADIIALGYWRWLQENNFETAWNHTMIKQKDFPRDNQKEIERLNLGNEKITYARLNHQEAMEQFDLYHLGKLPLHSPLPYIWSTDHVKGLKQIDDSPYWELMVDTVPMLDRLLKRR